MRKVLVILMALVTFLNATQIAQAASVIEKTSSIFSAPKQYDGKIRIDITGATVKYVRHAKYDDSRQTNVVQVAQVRADKITGFAYSCPGYYLTRAYSDSNGTKLLGYIRVHVKEGDVTTKGCPKVDNEEPKAPPPVINKTHPVPTVEEPKNMVKDGQDYDDGSGSEGGGGTTTPPEENEEIDWENLLILRRLALVKTLVESPIGQSNGLTRKQKVQSLVLIVYSCQLVCTMTASGIVMRQINPQQVVEFLQVVLAMAFPQESNILF